YILIDSLNTDFAKSLNVITGETGAGKSILISAIDTALGGKCSGSVIKTGSDKAVIELTVLITNDRALNLLRKHEIDIEGEEFVISREITAHSSKYRINGTLAGQNLIKELRSHILDIHSQHQSYTFIQPKYHIKLLDSYAKSTCGNLLEEYSQKYKYYTELKTRLNKLKTQSKTTETQIDFLKFQTDEIKSAEIQDSKEDETLQKEASVLENAEKLRELTGGIYWGLSGDENSINTALSMIKMNLSKAVQLDDKLHPLEEIFIEANELLHDLSSTIRDYSQNIENDTERLNQIQERLYFLDKLKRKYGGSLENVLTTLEKLEREYSMIENSTAEIEKTEQELNQTEYDLMKLAKIISEKRKNYAEVLSSLIVETLTKLELPKCRFEISVNEVPLYENGIDNVEFMISTNVSEPLHPLEKVASGGEISRIMLALKSIFAQNDDIDTVIFDEIDTGISGKTSQAVADEISSLAGYRQVIMITHQAILAAKADKHIYVKKTQGDSTNVSIYSLSGKARLNALAELAGGEITDESLSFAKTLVNQI
ncbi:MAG: DNA repair protein RecN, partial [Candidatus Gastranaerophilales bacterium]|nr:DNA repair protein RecN [Candidatus Gastranaerophilales bacterium]